MYSMVTGVTGVVNSYGQSLGFGYIAIQVCPIVTKLTFGTRMERQFRHNRTYLKGVQVAGAVTVRKVSGVAEV